ncbi:modulator protein [Aeromonas veronii]
MPDYQPISCDDRQWDDKIHTIETSEGVEYLLHSGERLSLAELATLRLNWQGEEKLIRFAPTN